MYLFFILIHSKQFIPNITEQKMRSVISLEVQFHSKFKFPFQKSMDNGVEDQDSSFISKPQYAHSEKTLKMKSLLKSKTQQTQSEQELTSKQILCKINRIVESAQLLTRKKSTKSIEGGVLQGDFKCKCKKTKCLKMYCECFALGKMCNGCSCVDCHNLLQFQQQRANAIDQALERDPNLFQPSITQNRGGCICKKTQCLKKYCECFNSGVSCTAECKCVNCSNK